MVTLKSIAAKDREVCVEEHDAETEQRRCARNSRELPLSSSDSATCCGKFLEKLDSALTSRLPGSAAYPRRVLETRALAPTSRAQIDQRQAEHQAISAAAAPTQQRCIATVQTGPHLGNRDFAIAARIEETKCTVHDVLSDTTLARCRRLQATHFSQSNSEKAPPGSTKYFDQGTDKNSV